MHVAGKQKQHGSQLNTIHIQKEIFSTAGQAVRARTVAVLFVARAYVAI